MTMAQTIRAIQQIVYDNVQAKYDVSVNISYAGKDLWEAAIMYYNTDKEAPEYAVTFLVRGMYYDASHCASTPEEAVESLYKHLCRNFNYPTPEIVEPISVPQLF
jgi:hypothetical protein